MGKDGGRDKMEKPLKGAVLCCTSIPPEQRTSIAEIATQMGAEHKLDLTSDVTHLLVGYVDTPKYKYVAREREDVKVLSPEWVEAVRQAWMHAEEFDLEALEQQYKLPIFAGLAICLTGFDNLTFRAQLSEQVTVNGGEYRGDLTKTVTHLIALKPEGKKYIYAQQWGIKIVGLKWFKDSLERGMILEEEDYHPTIPTAQQGLKAWNREAKVKLLATKRPREDDAIAGPPRKLRRSASAKFGSQAESLWEDIVGNCDNSAGDRTSLRPSKSMSSVKPVILEAKSFATDTTDLDGHNDPTPQITANIRKISRGFLQDTSFVLHGFSPKQTPVLRQHLQANGATILETELNLPESDSQLNFILVPYNCVQSDIPSTEDLGCNPRLVTDLWLEKCLLSKQFILPGSHALDYPIYRSPIDGFNQLVINSTAFEGIERLHVSKAVKTLGGTYDEFFKPGVSVLVSNIKRPSEERLRHAVEWKIPVVTADWLWACVRSGKLQPFKSYAIFLPESPRDTSRGTRQKTSRSESDTTGGKNIPSRTRSGRPGADFEDERPKPGTEATVALDHDHLNKAIDFEDTERARPLKEISPNSPTKRSVSPEKRKLFDGFDGASSLNDHEHVPPHPQPPCPTSTEKTTYAVPHADTINDAIEQLLKQKTVKSANTAAATNKATEDHAVPKKKRLLGRVLSNVSNASSREGTVPPQMDRQISRASSVDSMNTDGVGSIIYDDSIGQPSRPVSAQPASFTGRASASLKNSSTASSSSLNPSRNHSAIPAGAALEEESVENPRQYEEIDEPEPVLTQLGYANPADAVYLRELIIDGGGGVGNGKNIGTGSKRNTSADATISGAGYGEGRIKDDVGLMSIAMNSGNATAGGSSTTLMGAMGGAGRRTRGMGMRRREPVVDDDSML